MKRVPRFMKNKKKLTLTETLLGNLSLVLKLSFDFYEPMHNSNWTQVLKEAVINDLRRIYFDSGK